MDEALQDCDSADCKPHSGELGPARLRVQWAPMKALPSPPWMLVDPDDPRCDLLQATDDPLKAVTMWVAHALGPAYLPSAAPLASDELLAAALVWTLPARALHPQCEAL
eukprot:15437713-Alexandrium_andersonii.AAC.1